MLLADVDFTIPVLVIFAVFFIGIPVGLWLLLELVLKLLIPTRRTGCCVRCGYDLRGISGLHGANGVVCPECGRESPRNTPPAP